MEGAGTRTLRGARPRAERPEAGSAPSPAPVIRAVLAALGVASLVYLVAGLSVAHLPWDVDVPRDHLFPGRPWLEAWVHWDSGWYLEIADNGYSYVAGQQGPAAFFPAYPLLMRALAPVFGGPLEAGVAITLASGLAAAGLFWAWLRERMTPAAAWTALLLLLLYPYSFYLYGAVYADALFVAALIGAFLAVEKDRFLLAGLVGAVATAARPVGAVLVVGLVLRVVEKRGGWRAPRGSGPPRGSGALRGSGPPRGSGAPRGRDLGVLAAGIGVGGFCLYCWSRFGNPLLFLEAQEAWGQGAGWRTWFKLQFFEDVTDFRSPPAWVAFVAHPALAVVSLGLVPRVVRRFGWSYGTFTLLVLGVSVLSSKNFFGTARYVLAAFPCFAVAGEWLSERPRLRAPALVVSAAGLAVGTSFFARAHYLS